jgi:hypothetical protein
VIRVRRIQSSSTVPRKREVGVGDREGVRVVVGVRVAVIGLVRVRDGV